jgi:alkylation response protein AidB-like acyl-CoA dehydrogenase
MAKVTHNPLQDLAAKLGPAFAGVAEAHDQEGRFVTDNYRTLKEHRVFSAGVPAELGGGGASHGQICEFLRELAHHCPSTALAVSMHQHLIAAAVYRHLHGQPAAPLLRKVVEGELVLVSTGAGDWIDSHGRAEKVEGGYRVSATKRFGSGSPAGDLLMTSAPCEGADGTSEVLHFPVSLRAEGVSLKDDWDTLGMRATGSQSVELDRVFVPEQAVALRRPQGQWHPSWSVVITVAPPIFMAPYVGLAEAAAEKARAQARTRGLAAEPQLPLLLGELENELTRAQLAWRDSVALARDYDFEPRLETANAMLVRKTLIAQAAVATVEKAVEIAGGAAYFRRLGFERMLRDVHAAPFHPLPEKKQQLFTGRIALGLPPV